MTSLEEVDMVRLKRLILPTLLALLLILMTVGTSAQDATTITVTGRFIAIEGLEAELTAYEDATCLIPITQLEFGDVELGGSAEETFFLKNTGDIDFVTVFTSTGTTPFGGAAASPTDFPLAVGEIHYVTVAVTLSESAPLGVHTFTIFLVASET